MTILTFLFGFGPAHCWRNVIKQPEQFEPVVRVKEGVIAALALAAIALYLLLRFGVRTNATAFGLPLEELPLVAALGFGGVPLLLELGAKLWRWEFGSDLLAGISIVTSVVLGEYLAGSLVVLMLSGGEALEAYAVRSASSVLEALARRMPSVAHPQARARSRRRAAGRGRRRRHAGGLPPRDLPGRWHRASKGTA